jgi:hypothetical protein
VAELDQHRDLVVEQLAAHDLAVGVVLADLAEPHGDLPAGRGERPEWAVVFSGAREPQHCGGAAVDHLRVGDLSVREGCDPPLLELLDLLATLRRGVAGLIDVSHSVA